MTELAKHECTGNCAWSRTDRSLGDEPIFECAGCHSEWVPSQGWTPRNADGDISPDVLAVKPPEPPASDDDWGF